MNLPATILAITLSTGAASFSVMELSGKMKAVESIEYEPLEDISKGTDISEAKNIIRRNNERRRTLSQNLYKALHN
jgi:hypothetical protein